MLIKLSTPHGGEGLRCLLRKMRKGWKWKLVQSLALGGFSSPLSLPLSDFLQSLKMDHPRKGSLYLSQALEQQLGDLAPSFG